MSLVQRFLIKDLHTVSYKNAVLGRGAGGHVPCYFI